MYKSFRTISAQVFLGFEIAVSCNDIEIKCKRFDFTKKKNTFGESLAVCKLPITSVLKTKYLWGTKLL